MEKKKPVELIGPMGRVMIEQKDVGKKLKEGYKFADEPEKESKPETKKKAKKKGTE